jgi:hypothetical protein
MTFGEIKLSELKKYWLIIVSGILFTISIIFLILIAITGIFAVSNDIIVVLLTAVFGGFGWIFKSEYDKRREIDKQKYETRMEQERLTFETRRQTYEDILKIFIDALAQRGAHMDEAALRNDMMRAGFKLNIYGSDEVIRAYNNFRQLGAQQPPNPIALLVEFARLLIKIRKSTGFPDSSLNEEQILRSFIIDYDNQSRSIDDYIQDNPQL